ncbi:hypothetical protein HDK90DRAFT_300325 [Phyllosticta capitalensis]|uniref:Tyrosinase copper-binding domain-containing protein n=1 Tax=Phyllosticta capitalensis TaxID=121624 RepID=A0ABR1YK44_9PEZI
MFFSHLLEVAIIFAGISHSSPTRRFTSFNSSVTSVADFASNALNVAKASIPSNWECSPDKLVVRKEWGALSAEQRIDYTNAVLCLQSKKANTPSELVPGAKSRFDDFITTHINQTYAVHQTASFLLWHRWFVWEYEKALRDECGYKGYQPYWDWAKTAETGLEKSPIFDGSATSLSGNGEYIPSNGTHIDVNGVDLPDGTGGGCVKTGPFKDYQVNLGPIALTVRSASDNGSSIGSTDKKFEWNPRCFKRDLTDDSVKRFANETSVRTLISGSKDMNEFQTTMQGGYGDLGVHGGGHYALGGDPGRDFFVSPGDPAFYLHHANIDRTWWIWQQQHPSSRCSGPTAISGTRTFLNEPPSPNATYEDPMNLGWAGSQHGEVRLLKDVMSTTEGGFCYVYE